MTWSESWYINEQTDKPQNKLEGQSDKVYNTTDFLSKFEWNQNSIVSSCMQEIQSDTQLKEWFDNLLKSGISNDLINKIKKELEDNAELDEETLKILVQSILAESITDFKIGITGTIEWSTTQKVQKQAEAAQKEAEADRNEVEGNKNMNQAEKWGDMNKEMLNRCSDYREQLLVGHEELDQKINEEAKNIKDNLNIDDATKQKLEQNGIDEKFIDDYILVKVTLNKVRKDPSFDASKVKEFEWLVWDLDNWLKLSNRDVLLKSIDNACNIPDTNLSSFSSENIAQTRTELFHSEVWNDSLIQAKNQNMESRDYSNIFPEMWDDEIIANYGHFLGGDLKEFCQQYQNGPELKTRIENIKGNPSTDEERILLQNYQTMILELKNIKEQTENKTKNLMEELTIISQIKWMSMCIWQENWKDFNLNKANEIQNDNWVLTLKGHIDWVDFSVRHDTTKENAHLQTSSKLWMTPDRNTFMIWSQGQYTDSPFIMPSQEEIFSVITKEVQSDSNDLKNSDNVDSYLENLQQNIMWRMDKVYSEAKYAQHYIRDKVKWEKVMDSSLSVIKKIKPDIDINLAKPINQANSGKLHDFMKMINFNMENSTDTEKDKLCKCMSKMVQIAYDYKNTRGITGINTVNYPPIIENYLKNQTWLDDWNEDAKLWLIFDMLGYYNQNSKDTRTNLEWTEWVPSKVIINDLYRDLFEFSGGESEVSTKRTNERQEQKDRDEADDTLLLDNTDIWPPVE